jgi:hypothetical protein
MIVVGLLFHSKQRELNFSSINNGVGFVLHESNPIEYPKGSINVCEHKSKIRKTKEIEMAHEELKKQWEKDVKHLGGTAHTYWEWRDPNDDNKNWNPCDPTSPRFFSNIEYRRKQQPFQPEYFSGLNWREAEKLVGKVVEYSKDGGYWQGPGTLIKVSTVVGDYQRFLSNLCWWTYVRTTPETYAHPTITIGGVKLPRPEHIEPFAGTHYFSVDNGNVVKRVWSACPYDMEKLMAGNVHRTESRAQAWADWWNNVVMAAVRGGE